MRGSRTAVAIVWLAGLQGCQRDYRFNRHARHEAPLARLQISIEAAGLVRAGDDLSESATATVRVRAVPPGPAPVVELTIGLPDKLAYRVNGGPSGVGTWPPRSGTGLAELLQGFGYGSVPPDELAEIEWAIAGALAWPKGTLMVGQTRTLRVRRRGSADAALRGTPVTFRKVVSKSFRFRFTAIPLYDCGPVPPAGVVSHEPGSDCFDGEETMTPRANGSGRNPRVLTLIVAALLGGAPAGVGAQSPLPERLLTPADLERTGLEGVVRPSAEMYDPAEGLHFVTGPDSMLVLTVGALTDVRSSAELRTTMELLSKEVTAVSGVGDEAYLGLGGWMLVFRKGARAFQLLTGADVAAGGKVFLTPAQLTDLAKVFASRL